MKRLEGMIEQAEKFNPLQNLGNKKAPPFKKDEGPSLLIAGIITDCIEELEEELNDAGFQLKDGIRAKITPILTSGVESIVGPEGE